MPTVEIILEDYMYICNTPNNLSPTEETMINEMNDEEDKDEVTLISLKDNHCVKGLRYVGLELSLLAHKHCPKSGMIKQETISLGGTGYTVADDDLFRIKNPILTYDYIVPKNKHLRAFFGAE